MTGCPLHMESSPNIVRAFRYYFLGGVSRHSESWVFVASYFRGWKQHTSSSWWRHHWSFVRGIHRCPVNSPHKGQWRGALMFSLICALNKRLNKQSWGWWFETPARSLWRLTQSSYHCNKLVAMGTPASTKLQAHQNSWNAPHGDLCIIPDQPDLGAQRSTSANSACFLCFSTKKYIWSA